MKKQTYSTVETVEDLDNLLSPFSWQSTDYDGIEFIAHGKHTKCLATFISSYFPEDGCHTYEINITGHCFMSDDISTVIKEFSNFISLAE